MSQKTKTVTTGSGNLKDKSLHLWHMFKVISHSFRQYKKDAILSIVFTFFQAAFECTIPLVMSFMINALQEISKSGGDVMMTVALYAPILFVMAIVSLGTSWAATRYSSIASTGLAANLRQDLFYQTTRFSFENIDKFSKASLVTRHTTDVHNIENAVMMLIRFGVLAPFNLIFSLVFTFVVGWELAWVYCITVPIIVICLGTLMVLATKIYSKAFPKFDEINKVVEENVRGIRTVKTYTREDFEDKKFKNKADEIRQMMTKGEIYGGLNNPVLTCCIYLTIAFFTGFGAYMMGTSVIGIGNFQAMISYGINVLMALMLVSMLMVMVAMSFVSGTRVCEVLEEKPSIVGKPDGLKEIPDGSIEYKDVHFSFSDDKNTSDEEALKGIELKIASGETIGVIGGTGSAKSTLVNMLPRFYDPQVGEVTVGGHNVKEYDLRTLRDGVSMVLQKNVLFSGSLRENLQWGKEDATDEEIMRACDIACASEFVNVLPGKLDYHVEQGGTNFSGGQKQRLCIARAILKNPRVLVFDDSTSAVDTKTDAKIRASLRTLLPGVTKIIVAQRISSVADADRVIVMDAGAVENVGTPKELYAKSKIFREVCDLQGVKEEQLR